MSGAASPTLLPDLAVGDLGSLRASLSEWGTRGTLLTVQLDARLDTEKQDTLLTWAARHGQAEAVRLLLEAGASVGATDGRGVSALFIACLQGHVKIVRLLLDAKAAVDQANEGGVTTPLFIACYQGHLECARLLQQAGAAVNQAVNGGFTSLYVACELGRLEIARLLLEASAAVGQAAENGATPLFIACLKGHVDIVRLLLEAGAAVGQAKKNGVTPLSVACEKGQLEIARLLLEAGAAVNQAEEDGATPLIMACWDGHVDIARLLLEAGAAIDQANEQGATPLYMACQDGHLEVARLLLEAGAAVSQARNDGATPLFVACFKGHLEVAKLLSSYGASRAATPIGTSEEAASRSGHADLAAWLVASRGWTPLQHLEACPRLAAESVSALSSRPLPLVPQALTVDRARALLRGGADSSAGEPSALERARVLCSWGESDPTAAAAGSTVAIHSLVSRPSMNGKVGVVVSASASTGRFGVRVAGEAKALALRRAMASPPLAGSSLWTHPTPLPFPRPANLEPAAEAVEVGRLILKAAEWSPQSHELFPTAARQRAVEVMRLGYLIAWDEERFNGEGAAPGLVDLWRSFVLPRVVARAAAADASRSP